MSNKYLDYVHFVRGLLAPPPTKSLVAAFGYNSDAVIIPKHVNTEIMSLEIILNIMHCGYGITGEGLELALDDADMDEELGDTLFYTVGALFFYSSSPEDAAKFLETVDTDPLKAPTSFDALMNSINDVSDLIKKKCFYGQTHLKDGREINQATLGAIITLLHNLNLYQSLTILIESNTAKLSKRYTNKTFTQKEAVERADKCQDEV